MKRQFFATVLLLVAFAFGSVFAQEKGSPEQRADKMTQRMKNELSLNDTQVAKVGELNLERVKKQEAWKAQVQTGDKKRVHKERKAYMETFDTRLKAVLTAEQFTQYQQMQEERKNDLLTKRKDKQNGTK